MKECEILDGYININEVARLKGLKSNRAIRNEINKKEKSKYISRAITVKGGTSYEILISSLEPDIQTKIIDEKMKTTQLVKFNNNIVSFAAEENRLRAMYRINIVKALLNYRKLYSCKKEADKAFVETYNSRNFPNLKKTYTLIEKVSEITLYRWVKEYEEHGTIEALMPKYKYNKIDEYNTTLTPEMISVFKGFFLHENKFRISKAISLAKQSLRNRGVLNLPSDMTFRRYAEKFKKLHYGEWVLRRYGEKAFNDLVETYIERDTSVLEVGQVLFADGHKLNFEVINPYTGKPCRPVLVGFTDWKSGALVGYEIMVSENTQCIASALRNSIINLGRIPEVVYQDNGKAFRSKFFQNTNFDDSIFNGVYQNLGIKPVFAKVRNAKAKVIERFFREFQEEFEKMMVSYTGTSISEKPARLLRGEKLHKEAHKRQTGDKVPTIQEVVKLIDCWIEYHNNKPCPNAPGMTIKECLNTVKKEKIDVATLNYLMMKTETKTIQRNGIHFLGTNYYSEALFGLREAVFIRYSLFDLSQVHVYSTKGEFLCVAKRITKTHPLAYHLGNVKDMEDFNQKIKKQVKQKNKAKKEYYKYFSADNTEILEVEPEYIEIEPEIPKLPKQKN